MLNQIYGGRSKIPPVQERVDGVLSVPDSQISLPCVAREEKSIHTAHKFSNSGLTLLLLCRLMY